MPTNFENSKGYKVIVLSPEENKRWRRAAACDHCGNRSMASSFYVAAHNLLLCAKCYEEWCNTVQDKKPEQTTEEQKYLAHAILQLNIIITRFSTKSNN